LGNEANYNTDFDSRWTNSLLAQVPFGIDPRTSKKGDGIFVVPIEIISECFENF
jgi:hypothetical protein